MLNLRMSGENCLFFKWHSCRAAPGISFFGVITRDTVMLKFSQRLSSYQYEELKSKI